MSGQGEAQMEPLPTRLGATSHRSCPLLSEPPDELIRWAYCFLSVFGQQKDRHIPVAKELFRPIQRLLSCCHNEQIVRPVPTDPFDERFWLFSGGRSFDAQSCRCSQELCFLLR